MDQIKINGTITKTISDKSMLEENDIKKIDKPVDYCEIIRIRIQEIRNRLDNLKESKQYLRDKTNNGKSKIEIAKELHVHKETYSHREKLLPFVQRYKPKKKTTGRADISHLKDNKKLDETIINKIRDEVKKSKTKIQVANKLGISYYLVKKHTTDLHISSKIPVELEKYIRSEVKKGKTKIELSNQLGYTYYIIKKCTKGIITRKRISQELQKKIRDEYNKGFNKRQVAEKLHISYDTVKRYTRDILKPNMRQIRSKEQIEQIRQCVLKCNSKTEAAIILGLSYDVVRCYTRDIHIHHGISPEMKKKIRSEVKKSRTKMQVSRKLKIPPETVYRYTHDIMIRNPHEPGLSGNPLRFLREIMQDGYAKPSKINTIVNYRILKRRFPNIIRVSMYGKVIYFMQEHPEVAMRVFLDSINKKIYDYNTLKQITDVFQGYMPKKEKRKYIQNRKNKYSYF